MRPQLQHHTSLCPVLRAPSPASQGRPRPPHAGPAHQASTARRRAFRLPVGGAQQVRGEVNDKWEKEVSVRARGNSLGMGPGTSGSRRRWSQESQLEGGAILHQWPLLLLGYYCDSSMGPVQDFSLYPCPRGYYCPVGTAKAMHHSCPVGTYSPQKGLTSITECQLCPAGKFCSLAGITAPTGTNQGFLRGGRRQPRDVLDLSRGKW